MKTRRWLDFIRREWLLSSAACGLLATSVYFKRLPAYSAPEIQVLFILYVLFVAVNGLLHSGLMSILSRRIEAGRFVSAKLVITTFVLSMVVTNDVALVVMVPLTLLLKVDRKDILVILETLSANAGSALTPFGNPQNLFIYWYYGIRAEKFVTSIALLPFVFLVLLVLTSLTVKTANVSAAVSVPHQIRHTAYVYGALLILVVLTVLRILPVWAGAVIIFYALAFDRGSLRVDYALLFSFFCFFGLAQNLKIVLTSSRLENSGHIFLFSAISSQIISNVPTTLVLAKFTNQWQALLWGTSVGGFGSLVGSLANLIAYRLYMSHAGARGPASFTFRFILLGYAAFGIGIGLYFCMDWIG